MHAPVHIIAFSLLRQCMEKIENRRKFYTWFIWFGSHEGVREGGHQDVTRLRRPIFQTMMGSVFSNRVK